MTIAVSQIEREVTHPCAACKHLRRKCDSSCELAPYFPKDNPQRFEVVHRFFGRCNVAKILREIDSTQRENTVNSLVFEAETRRRNPVNGYLGYAHNLEHRLNEVQQETNNVKKELTQYLSPEVIQYVINNPNCFGFEPNNDQTSTAQLTAAQHQQLELLRQRIHGSDTGFSPINGDGFGQHTEANVPDPDGATLDVGSK